MNLNDYQFKTGRSNYQSTDQKPIIDTEKPKRNEKIILLIIKPQGKKQEETNREELQKQP